MEQITQQKTALDNTTQEQPKTVNETFNAMRTAALSMFQQRTKDLTRVSEMQQQAHDLEQEIECAQQTLSQLHTMCAKLDARVEEEERRTKERETHVKSVHTALFQLDEELKSYGRLKESSEHVGNVLHKFVHDTQSEESRFNQLLKEGMRVVGDRTPADFKNSAADLRRRTSLLKNYIHHLTSTGVVGEEFLTNLQKWSTGNWRQFPELSTVIQRSEEILQCTADEGSIQLTSDYPEVAQESLLFTVSPQDSSSETTVTDLKKQVSSLVDRYLHELDHLCAVKESLTAKCNELGITTTVLEEEALGQLRKDWSEMIAAHNEWCELHEKLQQSQAERDEADSRVALLNSDISQLQSKSAELGDAIAQLQETRTVLDDQVENYATATSKALFTLHKLKTSIHNVKQSIEKSTAECNGLAASTEVLREEIKKCKKEQKQKMEELDQRIAQEEITKASVEAEVNALRLQVEEVKQRRQEIEAVTGEVTAMTVQDDNTDAIVKLVATLHGLGKQSSTDEDRNKADTSLLSPDDLARFNVESFVQLFDGKDTISKEQVKSALCSLHPLYAEASMEPYIDDLHEMLKEVFTAEREHAKFLSESDREIVLLKKELNITAQ